ncbi:hypothetical protein [Streptomyces sp. HNM0574]|uniref:hypothetical protein n=1 Tax=Streptomyces sp. HNM0574 TaxID=2714954 RepID=UPI00146E00CC|nr:hypothetical protein [Streptomyces sp. HNM0574]NLU68439.1 hypothetical protein [Streptomyces sp. HNM0574]
MDSARQDFTRALWRLYEDAERPELAELCGEVTQQLPGKHELTSELVEAWLHGTSVPATYDVLRVLVVHLNQQAERAGNADGRVLSLTYWEALWGEVHRIQRAVGGGTPGVMAGPPAPGPPPAPSAPGGYGTAPVTGGATAAYGPPGAEAGPRPGTHTNQVDGDPRIGTSFQVRDVTGGIRIELPDSSGVPPPRGAEQPPQPEGQPPLLRVQRGDETYEFFDQGLATIWITARLQTGQGNESAQ